MGRDLGGLLALVAERESAPAALLVQRLPGQLRDTPRSVRLDPEVGVIGDRWSLAAEPNPDAMVTLMRWDVAWFLAERAGVPVALLGDNVFASLDTSAENLPPGTVLRVGAARCVVTLKPHRGCDKFRARVGADVLRFTVEHASLQLRGVHLRVLDAGDVGLGDDVRVESRPR